MSTLGNNISKEIDDFIKEYFIEARVRLFEKLMKDPVERRIHDRLSCQSAEKLYKKALDVLTQLNASHGDYEEEEELEYEFTHYLAAISDLIKIRERELTR